MNKRSEERNCKGLPEYRYFHVIARIHTDFPTKFGIPRQSGLIEDLKAEIVFEKEYRNPDALRGIEEFSHIWLIWEFSEAVRDGWSATVRPPRLGGNARKGVFATRSPFRPNAVGLSCVRLDSVEFRKEQGPVLCVSGADLMDGTPIFDIKPYLPFVDSHPEAAGGFTDHTREYGLTVEIGEPWLELVEEKKRASLMSVLAHDPRPSYQNDPERVYGMEFAGYEIKFTVKNQVLTVKSIEKIK
ncbi:tRNA (N6-threonylcarbamoyladenosine(37)-N6)-methyltransferase TrmO [Lachnospiraceae bacterium 45-P1]